MFLSMFLYFKRNISWNFDGLATISLSLSLSISVFVSISSLKEMVSNSFSQAYKVVSSTKLQISVSFMKRSKLLIKTLKRIGPSIDPCGAPRIISNHSLKDEPTFTPCCRKVRFIIISNISRISRKKRFIPRYLQYGLLGYCVF